MQTVTLFEAQKHLLELVRDLAREGELLITDADQPVARLVLAGPSASQNCADLAAQLQGAGRKYLKPDDDPVRDLITEREREDSERAASL
jgi:antitoxin (DNA-binding transcriptional repressor) of toxin-antitoxin stability system